MNMEAQVTALVSPLVAGRFYWDTPPDGVDLSEPFVVAQSVGGEIYRYVENDTPITKRHYRVQFRAWARRRIEASELMLSIERAIVNSTFQTQLYNAPVGDYEPALKMHGSRQDVGFWLTIDP